MMSFNQLQQIARKHGYRLVMEDKNYTDSTETPALYKGSERVSRYKNVQAVEKAFVHLIEQENK